MTAVFMMHKIEAAMDKKLNQELTTAPLTQKL